MDYLQGENFYDEKEVFDIYTKHRKWEENPNRVIEKPIFLKLLKGIEGSVLDIGCGYAQIANDLLELGIAGYTGIDSSKRMIEFGESQLDSPDINLFHFNLELWDYGESKYNWVISRLVFHYVLDLESIFHRIYKGLKTNGKFVFSVELVDNYFKEGERKQDWLNNRVIKYHRTLESYWTLLTSSGFCVDEIKEGRPEQKYFKSKEELKFHCF